jgi:hypothetical protein
VLPLLPRIRHVRQAHLRDGHLRDVDEDLNIATLESGRGRNYGCFQVRRRHSHAEVNAPTTFKGSHYICRERQIPFYNLGAFGAWCCRAFVFVMNDCAHWQTPIAQHLNDYTPDTAYAAGRAGY